LVKELRDHYINDRHHDLGFKHYDESTTA